MTRGRGRGRTGRVGKSSVRGNSAIRANMPTVPIPTIISSQQGGTNSIGEPNRINQVQTLCPTSTPPIQTSGHNSTPTINSESSPVTLNQSNQIGDGTSTQSNTAGEGESNVRGQQTRLVTLTPTGLEPSSICSAFITDSFKDELDLNGINWKGVSQSVRDFYFGEFKKEFHWDSSTNENAVRKQWEVKASNRYRDFISKLKKKGTNPGYVIDTVWEKWMRLRNNDECVKKSEINAKNRRGGKEVPAGTHTGGSISIGEHRKRLAVEKGRDPTPSELHLYVHTYDHDGKSFVDERARIVHERYEEILREKTESQTDVDQSEAYYQAVGGEKKRRIYGLGSQAKSYYGPNLCISSQMDASSSVPPSVSHTSTENLDEFMTRLIPKLTDYMLPIFIERVHSASPSHHPVTPISGDPSPIVLPPPTNVDSTIDPSVSD